MSVLLGRSTSWKLFSNDTLVNAVVLLSHLAQWTQIKEYEYDVEVGF